MNCATVCARGSAAPVPGTFPDQQSLELTEDAHLARRLFKLFIGRSSQYLLFGIVALIGFFVAFARDLRRSRW